MPPPGAGCVQPTIVQSLASSIVLPLPFSRQIFIAASSLKNPGFACPSWIILHPNFISFSGVFSQTLTAITGCLTCSASAASRQRYDRSLVASLPSLVCPPTTSVCHIGYPAKAVAYQLSLTSYTSQVLR